MKHVLPTFLENVADEVPSGIPYKLIAGDSFPMNNNRFAYFLKLLYDTSYSKQHKYGIAMKPLCS